MYANDEILSIIQDHTLITQHLDQLCCAIENPAVPIPNFVPVCNDGLVTEQLTTITEHIKSLRENLQ